MAKPLAGSGLVIMGQPLLFTKELAVKIGDRGAIFIQQTFFMVSRYGKDKDGERWLKWSNEKWQKRVFPFWSESTLHRIMREMEEKGWLLVHREPGATALYSIDLDRLEADCGVHRGVKMNPPQGCQNETPQGCQNDNPVPHIERDTTKREKNRETSRALRARPSPPSGDSSPSPAKPVKVAERKKLDATEVERRVRAEHRAKASKKLGEHPTVEKLILWWRRLLSDEGISSLSLSFTAKERGMMKNLIKRFDSGQALTEFIEFAVVNWKELRKKIVWDNNPKRSKLNEVPTFVEVYYNAEDILHYMHNPKEVTERKEKTEVFTDISKVPTTHPNYRDIARLIKLTGKAVVKA